ncbi:hypothetical protein UPYG_G00242580 [Umbra pygmaea]|uniref:Death domain-containing protein n=1 Tax=Umbra pygmaea TaxID=75934 RepID=A0ABD0WKY9_UMBPY
MKREREAQYSLLRLLWEVGEIHLHGVRAWGESLRRTAHTLSLTQLPPETEKYVVNSLYPDWLGATLFSVERDIKIVQDTLYEIQGKLDAASVTLRARQEGTTMLSAHLQECSDIQDSSASLSLQSDHKTDTENSLDLRERPALESRLLNVVCGHHGDDGSKTDGASVTFCMHAESSSGDQKIVGGAGSTCNRGSRSNHSSTGESVSLAVGGPQNHPETQLEPQTETQTRDSGWVTLGLTGRSADGQEEVPDACFVTAPVGVARAMTCEVADTLSFVMVTGVEQLVSSVLMLKVQDGTRCPFPISVALPFSARYRGNYRDVVVKVVHGGRGASYISPGSTEQTHKCRKGSYAEVKVYSLGLFAVVSCLRTENYTVPRTGLALKLSMDTRVSLHYLPGTFTRPVVAQCTLQPVEAGRLATVKDRSDAYQAVFSTSPLLHLAHPASQTLRRPLTITLPCPPNMDKMKWAGHGEEADQHARPKSGVTMRTTPSLQKVRALSASFKSSSGMPNELLVLLGCRDNTWNVLDQVTMRNMQNGLVSFDLTENFERLVAVRLLSSLNPSELTALVEELEESVRYTTVSVVLQQLKEDPSSALVAVLPSTHLSWEMSKLQSQGYCGPPEVSAEIQMFEGEQLLISFNGNITLRGSQAKLSGESCGVVCERITFHSQRENQLPLRLTEIDPFGNYSSPHYKGTAVFHRVTRGQLDWQAGEAPPSCCVSTMDPVCKLSLTLPKKVRTKIRTVSAKVTSHDQSDALSDSTLLWLSEELSEEDVSLLSHSLRMHRSSIQLARLQTPDSPAAQAFHILGLWKRGLPAAPHPAKAATLARCLAKSGRPDLAMELQARQAATRGSSAGPEE